MVIPGPGFWAHFSQIGDFGFGRLISTRHFLDFAPGGWKVPQCDPDPVERLGWVLWCHGMPHWGPWSLFGHFRFWARYVTR